MTAVFLDSSIREWVLAPIFLFVILASLLRQCIMRSMSGPGSKPVKLDQLHYTQVVQHSKTVLGHAFLLSPSSFVLRRKIFADERSGMLSAPPTAAPNHMQALMEMSDPSQMGYQFVLLAVNGGLAYLIAYMFSGFLVAKAPILLTYKFKGILQRGIDVPNLDVTYVSSLSWYFLVFFCSSSFLHILNWWVLPQGETIIQDNIAMSMHPMMAMGAGNSGPVDFKQLFQQELDSWSVVSGQSMLPGVEQAAITALG